MDTLDAICTQSDARTQFMEAERAMGGAERVGRVHGCPVFPAGTIHACSCVQDGVILMAPVWMITYTAKLRDGRRIDVRDFVCMDVLARISAFVHSHDRVLDAIVQYAVAIAQGAPAKWWERKGSKRKPRQRRIVV